MPTTRSLRTAADAMRPRRLVLFTTKRGGTSGLETKPDGRARLLQWSHLHEHWSEVGVFDTRAEARKYARHL